MELLEELRVLGVDIEEALHRVRGNQELYKELIFCIPEDVVDYEIQSLLQQGDYDQAALNAHALKGEMANLGVTPLYNWYATINSLLKDGKHQEAQEEYDDGVETLNSFLNCIKKYQ